MPWTVKDVDRHKKGLTPEQKKKWVKVANGILRDCTKQGGSTSSCEGKAIRIANSKFAKEDIMPNKTTTEKVPELALRFGGGEDSVNVYLEEGEDKEGRLEMVAYSGGIIKDHWYWGNLAIDLSGLKFSKPKYPVLEDHDRSRKIAFTKKPDIEENQLVINNGVFVDTIDSEEFQKLSKQGFPYEASIYAIPSVVERLDDDGKTTVNGYTFKGPGTIWRQAEFREVSVCVFGHDANTKSQAFANGPQVELSWDNYHDNGMWIDMGDGTSQMEMPDGSTITIGTAEVQTQGKEVKQIMDLKELKEKDLDGYNELRDEVKEEVTQEIKAEHDKEKGQLSTELETVKGELDSTKETLKELDKKETIRAERERQMTMERRCKDIWKEKLSESDLSVSAKAKLPDYVDPKKFVKDDGSLDEETFSAAVDEEIKYWTEEVGATVTVLGVGSSLKEQDAERQNLEQEEKKDDDWVKDMVAMSGQVETQQTA